MMNVTHITSNRIWYFGLGGLFRCVRVSTYIMRSYYRIVKLEPFQHMLCSRKGDCVVSMITPKNLYLKARLSDD